MELGNNDLCRVPQNHQWKSSKDEHSAFSLQAVPGSVQEGLCPRAVLPSVPGVSCRLSQGSPAVCPCPAVCPRAVLPSVPGLSCRLSLSCLGLSQWCSVFNLLRGGGLRRAAVTQQAEGADRKLNRPRCCGGVRASGGS
ncbi:unnamed protein product [Gadus morhua 'NCC']